MPVALRHWYQDHGRHDLAWRQTRDRWAVLVSEVMLAQTQVGRVAAVWPSFMERFPTPGAMAASSPGDVIVAWGNLGYPRRARRLWEAAGIVAATGWPDDLAALPGVGRYTAARWPRRPTAPTSRRSRRTSATCSSAAPAATSPRTRPTPSTPPPAGGWRAVVTASWR